MFNISWSLVFNDPVFLTNFACSKKKMFWFNFYKNSFFFVSFSFLFDFCTYIQLIFTHQYHHDCIVRSYMACIHFVAFFFFFFSFFSFLPRAHILIRYMIIILNCIICVHTFPHCIHSYIWFAHCDIESACKFNFKHMYSLRISGHCNRYTYMLPFLSFTLIFYW